MKITRAPDKNFGRAELTDIVGALLATDYKSPPWVVYYEEDYSYEYDK